MPHEKITRMKMHRMYNDSSPERINPITVINAPVSRPETTPSIVVAMVATICTRKYPNKIDTRITTNAANFGSTPTLRIEPRTGITNGSVSLRMVRDAQPKGFRSAASEISRRIIRTTIATMANCTAQLKNRNVRAITNILCAFLRLLSGAKNRRADTHHRRAFFDRHWKIVRHAHRQLTTIRTEEAAGRELVAQLPQPTKVWSGLFRVVEERRQRHQSDQFEPLELLHCFNELRQLMLVDARLRFLVAQVYLNEHRQ